jgi:hypothetical protein
MTLRRVLPAKLMHEHYIVTIFLLVFIALLLFTGSFAAISILTSLSAKTFAYSSTTSSSAAAAAAATNSSIANNEIPAQV